MSKRPDVQIIKPPNTLMKAETGSGRVKPDTQAIQRAEVAIKKIGVDFPKWARDNLRDGMVQSEPQRVPRKWHAQGKSTAACSTPSTAGSRSLFIILA